MAIDSWWQFGEGSGHWGSDLALFDIECAFCEEKGNWELEHHAAKTKPNSRKVLNFDTYKCGNCANYIMVFWSADEHHAGGYNPAQGLHAYRTVPFAIGGWDGEDYWPDNAKRHWKQAHNAVNRGDYDAAVVMARSAVQAIVRDKKAKKGDLYHEINDLVVRGMIPNIVGELAHEVRELAKPSAHPTEDEKPVEAQDAREIVEFLDILLEYGYDLPHKINEHRKRQGKEPLLDEPNSEETPAVTDTKGDANPPQKAKEQV
jgi:HEPN domain-containing protein